MTHPHTMCEMVKAQHEDFLKTAAADALSKSVQRQHSIPGSVILLKVLAFLKRIGWNSIAKLRSHKTPTSELQNRTA